MEVNRKLLIVNYLPQQMADQEFHAMFASMGQVVSSKVVRDRNTGYSLGFGFVEYSTEFEAANAIQAMNGIQLQNKTIKVSYSRQGGRVKGAKLYVRGLPREYTELELEQLFMPYGDIVQCRVLNDTNTGISRGIGFVLFSLRDQAESAITGLNNTTPAGFTSTLFIQFAEDSSNKHENNKNHQSAAPAVAPAPTPPVQNFIQPNVIPAFMGGNPPFSYPVGFGMDYGVPGAGGNFSGPMRNQGPKQRYTPMRPGGNRGNKPSPAMGHIIFAYNIGPDTTEDQLRELFSYYGTVLKSDVIRDRTTNAGRGYGFVTMPNYTEAVYAIQCLNGYCYSTKPLQVSFKSAKTGIN